MNDQLFLESLRAQAAGNHKRNSVLGEARKRYGSNGLQEMARPPFEPQRQYWQPSDQADPTGSLRGGFTGTVPLEVEAAQMVAKLADVVGVCQDFSTYGRTIIEKLEDIIRSIQAKEEMPSPKPRGGAAFRFARPQT